MAGSQTSNSGEPVMAGHLLPHHRLAARRRNHAPTGVYHDEDDPLPDEQEEVAPVTVRHVLEGLFHSSHHEHARYSSAPSCLNLHVASYPEQQLP